MKVYCETIYGPQLCKVVREIDKDFVELDPVSVPNGPFGFIEPGMRRFTAYKSQCWKKAKRIGEYGTRHLLIDRPAWKVG